MLQDTQVIVFASQKGGSGKTTLSGHVAVEAELNGAGPVAIIDTDPQGSLSKWWNARQSDAPLFVRTHAENLARDIEALKQSGIKLIVIDTPPAVTSAIADVVAFADLVVVPTRPSPHDLRAVGVTVDLVEAQQKPLLFVVNCATARARITSETAVSLSQHGTVAPTTLHNRVDFAASMIDGRTVGEVSPTCRSAKEVATLWKYIAERLKRQRPLEDRTLEEIENRFELELLTPVAKKPTSPAEAQSGSHSARAISVPPDPVAPASRAPRHGTPSHAAPSHLNAEHLSPGNFGQEPDPDGGWIGAAPAAEAPMAEEETINSDHAFADRSAALERLMEVAKNTNWDGVDRRRTDHGPPEGREDRRQYPVFGRKTSKSG